jgi:hypothetical protein
MNMPFAQPRTQSYFGRTVPRPTNYKRKLPRVASQLKVRVLSPKLYFMVIISKSYSVYLFKSLDTIHWI